MIDLKNKKLYRAPRQGIIVGVAAGLGAYFDVDPVFVRLVWLALGVLSHVWPAVVLYGALFLLLPVDPAQESVPQSQTPKDVTAESPTKSEPVEHMDADQNM